MNASGPISLTQKILFKFAHLCDVLQHQADALTVSHRRILRQSFLPFAVVSGCVVFLLDAWLPVTVAVGALYTGIVLMSLWSPHRYSSLWVAGSATVFLLAACVYFPDERSALEAMTDRAAALMTLWIAAVCIHVHKQHAVGRERLVHDLVDGLAGVKTLQGLLAICVSCKKVRDEHERWHDIGTYLETHSEAVTSQDVCPDCCRP